jgi:membrane protein DedA with SNARE-associated domain
MVLGTSLDYAMGRWGLHATLGRTRLMARLEPKLAAAQRFLARHGAWALVLAHFIGHVRSFVAITAGASRLPYRRFVLYEGIAALAWNLVWIMAGYLVGKHLDALQRIVGGTELALVVLALIAYVAYRLVAHSQSTRTPTT